jgi:hypothetical protein
MYTNLKSLGWILSLFFSINPVLTAESILLPDLFRPELIKVDHDHIYITEGPHIYIYSTDDFKLQCKFGAAGEGPQEFSTGGMVFGWLWLSIQSDYIFIHSMGKISYYSKGGEFIRERKINVAFAPAQHPIDDKYVGVKIQREDTTNYWITNLYDSDFNTLKELFRSELANQPNRNINPLGFKTSEFCVFNRKIFIADTDKTGEIYIFDEQGNKIRTLKPDYEKISLTGNDKKRISSYFSSGPWADFYQQNRSRFKMPKYYPPFRFINVSDDKIYLMTYKKEQEKTQFLILDLAGRLIHIVLLPVGDLELQYFCPFEIKNNKIYHFDAKNDSGTLLKITKIE